MRVLSLLLILAAFSVASANAQTDATTTATPAAADTITVTATRTPSRLADTPASVVVLSSDDVNASAGPTVDDALRQVPGFTLFRRTDSRAANPTSQGVSLRGVGASGASRALVLDDGIPLNDPFGGWVYWGRVPRAALERIEVVRGGESDLYGSAAMGGVVQFVRRAPTTPAVIVDLSAGSERTATTSLFAADQRGPWRGSIAGDFLTTAGYVLVVPEQRGPVDTPATSRHVDVDGTIERGFGDAGRAFLRASHYEEARNNGTPLQTNDTTIRQFALGADAMIAGGSLLARAYGSDQDYVQTFSAVADNRASERLTVDQRVPSRAAGGNAQWSRVIASGNALLTGIEGRQVSGASDELQFAATGTTSTVRVDGKQRTVSAFVEDVYSATDRLAITAGIRYDGWRDFDAERNGAALADRSDSAWSPRLSLFYRAADSLSLTASAYHAFRAPVLNELYRNFRVGNVQTLANPDLGPERLSAVEVGARSGPVRVNLFWMDTDDTIANVTLTTTPALITRQRQNLGSSRARGVEVEGDWHLGRQLRLSAGYLFSDSVVTSGDLDGKRLPQVPRNQGTLQLTYVVPRVTLSTQMRYSGAQFDDDVNQFSLRGYFAVDALAAIPIARGFDATLAFENIFDRRIEAAATPVITIGQPREIRVGLRYSR